jgi:hypothetical protein
LNITKSSSAGHEEYSFILAGNYKRGVSNTRHLMDL